jgi:DNA-binding SARP family transcriptional activator
MEFRILGPLQVLDGDVSVEITGAKQQAVLALLVLRANEMVGSERLIDELWGEQAPRNAAGALYNHVSRLRKALGPEVLARREWGYVLRTPPESIDLRRFEALVSDAEPLPARERAQKLTEALALWRGPPLAGLESEVALQREIARLDELHVQTVERRIDADLEAGRSSDLVGELEMLIAEHPLREHLRWQLILSLYRGGRQAEALEVYRETRRVLAEELGLDPSPELRELEKAILRQDPTLAVAPKHTRPTPPSEQPRRSRRRVLLGGLLGLAVLASGAAAAVALIRSDRTPRTIAGRGTLVVITRTASTEATTSAHPRPPHIKPKAHRPALPPTTRTSVRATTPRPANPPTANTHTTTNAKPPTTTKEPTKPLPVPRTPRTSTTTPKSPPTRFVTISDTFDGDTLDPTIWRESTSDANVSMVEQGGSLLITIGSAAQPVGNWGQIEALASTKCTFPRNFDARVDYTLPEWPAGENVYVQLTGLGASFGIGRISSSQWGEQYNSWITPGGGVLTLPDTTGSLRITRVGPVVTTYFSRTGKWVRLASGDSPGLVDGFGLQAVWNPDPKLGNDPFGRQELKVAFDNFTVTGAAPICPPGSQPPGS